MTGHFNEERMDSEIIWISGLDASETSAMTAQSGIRLRGANGPPIGVKSDLILGFQVIQLLILGQSMEKTSSDHHNIIGLSKEYIYPVRSDIPVSANMCKCGALMRPIVIFPKNRASRRHIRVPKSLCSCRLKATNDVTDEKTLVSSRETSKDFGSKGEVR